MSQHTESEIRQDERLRVAKLIDASADCLVDFTGGSTLATLELVSFLLRLEQADDTEPTTRTLTVTWAPEAIKATLSTLIAYRDGRSDGDAPPRQSQMTQIAIDALRTVLGDDQ
jgi:hypothetical protein